MSKIFAAAFVVSASVMISVSARAQSPAQIQGSDTLASAVTDAIVAGGLTADVVYVGGGSGLGEAALLAGTQGIAPMSRAVKPSVFEDAQAQGVSLVEHVIGLDGVAVFTSAQNALPGIALDVLKRIYACEVTRWEDVPGAQITGPIAVYRRNDSSGTTDTFRSLVGLSEFGACAVAVESTEDIAARTASEANALGFAGLSGQRENNHLVAVAPAGADAAEAVPATVAAIRAGTYPLARNLYVYEVSGARTPSAVEAELLALLLDRSFMDPILQDNGFFTLSD